MTESTMRCGWRVERGSRVLDEGTADLVRISDGKIRFYLAADLYESLDDEAFVALCQQRLETARIE